MKRLRFGTCVAIVALAGCGAVQQRFAPQAGLAPRVAGLPVPTLRVRSGVGADVAGLTPADLQSAYNLPSSTKGNGQIVALVDAYDNPNVASDLAAYRSEFGLGTANFTKYNQDGQQSNYPQGSPGWGVEIDVDAEMVSASCPNCTIYLIEADSNSWSDLEAAEQEAVRLGAHIVSNAFSGTGGDGSYFNTKGVTYLASGTSPEGEPATFPHVVAVGGTDLRRASGKRGWSESASGYSEGACVTGVSKPRWQYLKGCDYLLVNQVAAAANDLAIYDSYDEGGWMEVSGTSTATPFLAGVFGLAGNATKQDGGRTFWQRDHHKYLYTVSAGSQSCALTSGRYNTCTGWGSPNGIGAF